MPAALSSPSLSLSLLRVEGGDDCRRRLEVALTCLHNRQGSQRLVATGLKREISVLFAEHTFARGIHRGYLQGFPASRIEQSQE
jgi:hypothetical protein